MRGLRWMSACAALGSLLLFSFESCLEAFSALPTDKVLQDPSILEEQDFVDVVYTWVDTKDPAWNSSRKQWLRKTKGVIKEAKKKVRTCSFDELKYSLRSVDKYAPFVRHIFIVTSGKKPKWLANHPKITVVSHKDIFGKSEHLPTFNQVAIEANLHRIPELASRYIYFHNNVYLGKQVTRNDFFEKPYKIKVFFSDTKIFEHQSLTEVDKVLSQNLGKFLEQKSKVLGLEMKKEDLCAHAHTPLPMIKWIAELTEQRYPSVFADASSHKFPNTRDMSLANGLIPMYALRQGAGVAEKPDFFTVVLTGKVKKDASTQKKLLARNPKFFCVQSSVSKSKETNQKTLHKILQQLFPNPAPWEKSEQKKHK